MKDYLIDRQSSEFTYSVQIPGGAYITRKLKEGDTVSIGSNDTADLRLDSPGIAGMHCLLTVEEGLLTIKDCYSPAGTFVNGQRIQDMKIRGGCTLRLDHIEIELRNKNEPDRSPFEFSPQMKLPDPVPATSKEPSEYGLPQEAQDDEQIEIQTDCGENTTAELNRLLNELDEFRTENLVLRERLDSLPAQQVSQGESDPFQAEMLDLMRQEIEALRQELEQRNSADFPFDLSSQSLPTEQLPDREEVEKLVDRLEDLLDELQEKDEHIQVLQDLILAGDTANQAEQEEREQLAKWLGEFEQRFEHQSAEWEAEHHHLQKQVNQLEQDRADAISALAADSNSAKTEALRRMAESLRNEVAENQTEIHFLKEANSELRNELELAKNSTPREEEVRLAKERAEIARMRHDLEVRLQKIQKSNETTDEGEVEIKLRNLTQELRGTIKNNRENSSLSSRFLSLWGRLNG